MSKIVKSDSKVYRHTFYGILNAQGHFWTPLAFDSEDKARQHIIDFWGPSSANRDKCLRTHRIVPVRVRLETLPAIADQSPKGRDPERGSMRSTRAAVAKPIAQPQSSPKEPL